MKPEYIAQFRIGDWAWADISRHQTLYRAKQVIVKRGIKTAMSKGMKYRVIKIEVVA